MSVAQPAPATEPVPAPRPRRWPIALATGALLTLFFVLLWGLNMRRGINHDEHQFIAGAAYMARTGARPYADFPYFHVPVLSLIYAALFRLSNELLLTARLFSVICAWLTLGLLMWVGYRARPDLPPWLRLATGGAAAALLAFTPLFVYTSGRAWNHDFPLLLSLLAFLLLEHGLLHASGGRRALAVGLAGALIALAAGARLSFALTGAALLAAIWIQQRATGRERLMDTFWFGIGGLAGALPVLYFFARDPAAFLFDNLGYVGLNTAYYQATSPDYPGMTLTAKLGVWTELLIRQPANLLPWIAFLVGVIPDWRFASASDRWRLWAVLLLLVSAILGALSPTPTQTQYFYAVQPWLVLGAVCGLAAWPAQRLQLGVGLLGGAALLVILLTARAYAPGLAVVARPDAWVPRKVHARGELLAGLAGEGGKVLTLAPIHPLEGGAPIYRQFVTGPFAWRVAPLVDAEIRARMSIAGPDDLDALLAQEPPRALLTGLDNDDEAEEAPLVAYAETHGYVPVALPDEGLLWLSPLAEWAETIRLGAASLPNAPLDPGERFVATFYLQGIQPMERDLNVLVRVVGADGEELLRDEGWPQGRPTSTWQPGAVWDDGHELTIPDGTAPGYYRVEVSFYDPATLETLGDPATAGYLRVGEPPDTPVLLATLKDGEGDALLLHEADIQTTEDGVAVRTVWQAARPLARDYTAFVHVVDGGGQLVAQHDSPPLNGFFPTGRWRPGWPVADEIAFDLPPGEYSVYAGFYDPETGDRLAVYRDGEPAGDAVTMGTVRVE